MGQLTRDEIVSNGLNLAGKTSLTTLANTWLNAWLKSTYEAWPWPFLLKQATGISLTSGATSLTLGSGSGGISGLIQNIFDPIFVYSSDFRTRGEARVRQLLTGPVEKENYVSDPTTIKGLPSQFKCRESDTTEGQWTLQPYPLPQQDYLLSVNYKLTPAAISSGSSIPRYPNDRTLMQAVMVEALKYMGDERYGEALDVLRSLVNEDKMKSGNKTGSNDVLGLDEGVFRRRG